MLNIFVLVAGVVALDVIESRPPATMPYPVALAEDAPAMAPQDAAPVNPDRLRDKLNDPMSDSGLGDGLSAYVADAPTGDQLFGKDAGQGAVPASTTKIVTAVSALSAVGPDKRINTDVVRGEGDQIILVGGGDPTLTATTEPGAYPHLANLHDLAQRTAKSLSATGVDSVSLGYDDTLYPGPATGPGWKPTYVDEGSVAPVHALMLDGGRVHKEQHYSERVPDPPRAAANAFAAQLREAGLEVTGAPSPAEASEGAEPLATTTSPPMSALVEKMLVESDNNIAEALFRQIAIAKGEEPSFAGGSAAVDAVMSELGVADVHVEDGSGLSVRNQITPKALVDLLLIAADEKRPELRFALSGLPTANFTGTLADRYSDQSRAADGAGVVRAKTGTLSGVSTLAGIVYDADGRLLAFAFMANDEAATGRTLDTFANVLAQCGCS